MFDLPLPISWLPYSTANLNYWHFANYENCMGSQFNSKQLRILCLHGYRQNDSMFREKLGGLRKQFKKIAHFEFINAPLIPNVSVTEDRGAGRGWWFSKQENVFSSRDVTNIATGFEESVKTICQYIDKNGPFDGVLGFSQGASMAHLILAMEHLVVHYILFPVFFESSQQRGDDIAFYPLPSRSELAYEFAFHSISKARFIMAYCCCTYTALNDGAPSASGSSRTFTCRTET
uniref:FSH1 domain-containing protein n=1 Tax=Heterorhabditis bacteriophora TaxID=37862 RepID=A0A1I7WSK9_HETBA